VFLGEDSKTVTILVDSREVRAKYDAENAA
jgi:hypothetical protein